MVVLRLDHAATCVMSQCFLLCGKQRSVVAPFAVDGQQQLSYVSFSAGVLQVLHTACIRQTREEARKRRWAEEVPQIHGDLASAEKAEEKSPREATSGAGGGGNSTIARTHAAGASIRVRVRVKG